LPDQGDADEVVARLRAAGCVFAEDEARMLRSSARDEAELAAMVDKRALGLPLEQVVGWAGFCGLRIEVDPGVFVPRRRTEFLVAQAAFLAGQAVALTSAGPIAVDLCCGSGAVGVALAARVRLGALYAADLDPVAVRCARRNLEPIGARVSQGDLYDALPPDLAGRVDIVTANVPYVPTGQISLLPAEARRHEARAALDGGPDGLEVASRVAAGAVDWLAPGGHVLVEISESQAPAAMAAFTRPLLSPRLVSSGELDATVVIGTKAGEGGG
jgi:release factor glutamine methyltransferase